MGDFDLTYIEDSADDANTLGVVVTASASANTKGSYAELIASTSSNAVMLKLTIAPGFGALREGLIDIATGAASSEVVLIANIKYYAPQDVASNIEFLVPISSGTRISARVQGDTGSETVAITATLYSGTFTFEDSTPTITTWGADTSNSRGSLIPDPGGSADTLGAWTEIVASSPDAVTDMVLSFGGDGNLNFGNNYNWLYQIGTGSAASEVVVHGGTFVSGQNAETLTPVLVGIPVIIPASTRIAIRCQCNQTNAIDRLLDVSVIGINSALTAAGGGGGTGGIKLVGNGGGLVG